MGFTMGAAFGVIMAGLEERVKGVMPLDGGFVYEKPLPGAIQADFAARSKAPVLMVTGQFDWVFWGKDAILRQMATPATNQKAVAFDTAHDVSGQRPDLVREVLAWLDRHCGKVQGGRPSRFDLRHCPLAHASPAIRSSTSPHAVRCFGDPARRPRVFKHIHRLSLAEFSSDH